MITILVLLILSNIGSIFLANKILSTKSKKINQLSQDAFASQKSIQKISSIKNQLDSIPEIPKLLDNIAAIKNKNKYQEEIIDTMKSYSNMSNLSIDQINFNSAKIEKNNTVVSVNLSLRSPLSYNDLINFIKLTENSLLRMQITEIEIKKSQTEAKEPNLVNVGKLNINVFSK